MPNTQPRKSLEDRLAKYGAMSVAAAAAALAPSAQAGIIVNAPTGGPVTTPQNGSIYFTMGSSDTTQLSGDFRVRNWFWSSSSSSSRGAVMQAFGANAMAGYSYPYDLPAGVQVADFSGTYWLHNEQVLRNSSGSGYFNPGQRAYVGLRIQRGADTYYGWADITVNPNYTVTLHRWAYEDVAGAGILTGATAADVPEPASILLMALGVAGLALYRKRRTA